MNDALDADKFYLGSLCKRNHNYKGSGKSLRHKGKNECTECRKLSRAKQRSLSGNYLGKLCKRNHDHQSSGKSLRRRNTGGCIECHKLRSYGNKRSPYYCPDYFKYRTWLKNPRISSTVAELVRDSEIKRHKESRYQWDEEYRENKKNWFKQRYRDNQEQEIERVQEWKRGNSEKVSLQNLRRKNRVDRTGDRTITPDYLAKLKSQADYCAYCKCKLNEDNKTIDHAVPVALGGLHSVENVVVCCERCNLRKGYMPLNEWLDKSGITSPF